MITSDIKIVRNHFFKTISQIPDFIDCKLNKHKLLWDAIYAGNEIIMNLVVNKTISDRYIKRMSSEFENVLEIILHISTQLETFAYYITLIESMINVCEEFELFESCSNLKRFYDINFV